MPTGSEILEHEPGDLTCIVEGGIRLSVLMAALAEHGQRLSLDPPGDPTLAECLLDDLSGPLRHRFGTMRDLVLGVTVVLPDGMRASSGGKVVKNVAGYDLAKLFCGSRGRLGSVERLALRLHPLPAATRTVVDARGLVRAAPLAARAERGRPRRGTPARALRGVAARGRRAGARARRRGRARAVGVDCARCRPSCPGRVRWSGEDALLVRPGPRVAYVAQLREPAWSPLAERVVEAMCSPS